MAATKSQKAQPRRQPPAPRKASAGKGPPHLLQTRLQGQGLLRLHRHRHRARRLTARPRRHPPQRLRRHPRRRRLHQPRRPHIILERQYRHAAGQFLLELPAGRIEPGEAPLAAAKREMIEETGYRAKKWTLLIQILRQPRLPRRMDADLPRPRHPPRRRPARSRRADRNPPHAPLRSPRADRRQTKSTTAKPSSASLLYDAASPRRPPLDTTITAFVCQSDMSTSRTFLTPPISPFLSALCTSGNPYPSLSVVCSMATACSNRPQLS